MLISEFGPGFRGFVQNSFLIRSRLTHDRSLHRCRDAVNDDDAVTAALGRDRTRRVIRDHPFDDIPVVRNPGVARRVDDHVGDHLDTAALENVNGVASLCSFRVAFGIINERSEIFLAWSLATR